MSKLYRTSALSFHAASGSFNGRRILQAPPVGLPGGSQQMLQGGGHMKWATLDANVIILLTALLCALLCALGLNFIVRCSLDVNNLVRTALRGGRGVEFEPPRDVHVTVEGANAGVKKVAVNALATVAYGRGLQTGADCPICLADFVDGENVRVLPKCNHVFHVDCIDTWLLAHPSCPTCRRCLPDIIRGDKSGPAEPANSSTSAQPGES